LNSINFSCMCLPVPLFPKYLLFPFVSPVTCKLFQSPHFVF
jgi:hypothetical protein